MAYRTKVEVRTMGKVYKPGSILPDGISALDLAFLKSKKFVELVEGAGGAAADEDDEFDEAFDEMAPGEYKSAEQIRKIKKKEDVYTYALSIGLNLGDDFKERSLKVLQEEVINYQEEKEADEGGDDSEESDN